MTDDLATKARHFAIHAHGNINHRRKYTGEPYVFHPIAVAGIVMSVTDDPAMIAAAYLHDTVEDTPTTLADILWNLGEDVANLVDQLTDVSRREDGNRATRKALDRAHTARASARGKTVKLADLIDNTRSIVAHDPNFARIYLREKALLLPCLREGDSALYREAERLLLSGCASLNITLDNFEVSYDATL